MPSHHHGFKNSNGVNVVPAIDQAKNTTWGASFVSDSAYKIAPASGYEEVGGDQAHDNMQPYTTLYMWRRTA